MADGNVTLTGAANSALNGEVWNPFEGAKIESWQIDVLGDPASHSQGLLDLAHGDGFETASTVKLVRQTALYSFPDRTVNQMSWSLYVVCDAGGKVLTAYEANDQRLLDLGLPETPGDGIWATDLYNLVDSADDYPSLPELMEKALMSVPDGGTFVQNFETSKDGAPEASGDEYLQQK